MWYAGDIDSHPDSLKLPKELLADPRHAEVQALLGTDTQLLWEKGEVRVPRLPLTPALEIELRHAVAASLACQGLEQIERTLEREQKGLDQVAEKLASQPGGRSVGKAPPPNARISRVLFIADDGSVRFYRDCERLLSRYSARLLGCRLSVSGDALGAAIFGEARLARAVLVTDKGAAARALLALLPR